MPVGGQRIVHAHRSRNTDPEAGCGCGVVSRTVPVVCAITATPAESGSEHSEPPPRSRVPPTDTRLLSSKSPPSPSPRGIDSRHIRCTLPPPATIRAGSAPARRRTAKARRAAARGRGGEGRGGSARCGRQAAVSLLSGKPVSARRPSAGRNSCRWPLAKVTHARSGGRCQVSIHVPAWSGGGRRTRKSLSRFPSWHAPGQRSGRGPRCACMRTAVPDEGRAAPRRAAPAGGRSRPAAGKAASSGFGRWSGIGFLAHR